MQTQAFNIVAKLKNGRIIVRRPNYESVSGAVEQAVCSFMRFSMALRCMSVGETSENLFKLRIDHKLHLSQCVLIL